MNNSAGNFLHWVVYGMVCAGNFLHSARDVPKFPALCGLWNGMCRKLPALGTGCAGNFLHWVVDGTECAGNFLHWVVYGTGCAGNFLHWVVDARDVELCNFSTRKVYDDLSGKCQKFHAQTNLVYGQTVTQHYPTQLNNSTLSNYSCTPT